MDGVILFADDEVFSENSNENKLFRKFNSDSNIAVLPIDKIDVLEKTVASISTYRALILDWNFKRQSDCEDDGIRIPDDTPFDILKNFPIYSIVYVYSQNTIPDATKTDLEDLFSGKIFFEQKSNTQDIDSEYNKILNSITQFENDNKHMSVPFVWSQAINKSVQKIFGELENADKFWMKELFYSSVRKSDKDGIPLVTEVDPSIEVIILFQNVLSERLFQDICLKKSIEKYSIDNYNEKPTLDSVNAIYSKLYYTKTLETDTIMTGDIYELSDTEYGIIVSPECNMITLINKNKEIEMLSFTKDGYRRISDICKNDVDKGRRLYNQEDPTIHILPIFHFGEKILPILIDFKFSLKLIDSKYLTENKNKRMVKLNSPYIQQLRQRYLSYIGRVGVPAVPNSLIRLD